MTAWLRQWARWHWRLFLRRTAPALAVIGLCVVVMPRAPLWSALGIVAALLWWVSARVGRRRR